MEKYVYNVEWLEDEQVYVASCSGYPAIKWRSQSKQVAIEVLKSIITVVERMTD